MENNLIVTENFEPWYAFSSEPITLDLSKYNIGEMTDIYDPKRDPPIIPGECTKIT